MSNETKPVTMWAAKNPEGNLSDSIGYTEIALKNSMLPRSYNTSIDIERIKDEWHDLYGRHNWQIVPIEVKERTMSSETVGKEYTLSELKIAIEMTRFWEVNYGDDASDADILEAVLKAIHNERNDIK